MRFSVTTAAAIFVGATLSANAQSSSSSSASSAKSSAASSSTLANTSSDSVSSTATASSTASASTSTSTVAATSAMIPSNISSTCTTFLNTLDSSANFATCMTPLVNITAIYSPTASNADNLTTTTSDVVSTLSSLCSSSTGCSDDMVRSYLADFYTACTPELTSATAYSESVRLMYDYLYVVNPFLAAVCGKDTKTKTYCVLEIASSALTNATSSNGTSSNAIKLNSWATTTTDSTSAAQLVIDAAANLVIYTSSASSTLTRRILNSFVARADDDSTNSTTTDSQTIVTPNTTTYRTTSLPYLFLSPNTSSSVMCTSCTTSVMSAYVAWEAQVPYALGLSSSPILGAQAALWKAISNTCGTNFTTAITTQAGVLIANGTLTASTSSADKVVGSGVVGLAIAGLMGLVLSVWA